jgi:hypothetical protein
MYLSLCKYEKSGEGALLGALYAISAETIYNTYKGTAYFDEFNKNTASNSDKIVKRVLDWGNKNFPKMPDNLCENGNKYPPEEQERQFEKFKKDAKDAFKSTNKQNTSKTNNPAKIKTHYANILGLLNRYANAQDRFRLISKNGNYATDFSMLDVDVLDGSGKRVSGSAYEIDGFKISLKDNPDGWALSALQEHSGYRSLLIKNVQTGAFCCNNIDDGVCETIGLGEASCEKFGLKIKLRKQLENL